MLSKSSVEKRGKMKGTESSPVQIDEARFAGHRKYNKARMLDGDHEPEEEDEEEIVENNRNHGRRIDETWKFGLIQGRDVRYFYVERRHAETFNTNNPKGGGSCFNGSLRVPTYRQLQHLGFEHETVNHQCHATSSIITT